MKAAVLAGLAAAQAFAPIISPGAFDAPTACYYRQIPAPEGRARFVYWFSWPDERHPKAWAHYPYLLWRLFYFGGRQDIEYVLVEADLSTGKPVALEFESPEVGAVLVKHAPRRLEKDFPVSGTHPVLTVASWNHLFSPGGEVRGEPLPLTEMDAKLYERLRISRRSLPR